MIPALLSEVWRLLGILDHKRRLFFREFQIIGIRQMAQTVPLLLPIARGLCQAAHDLKIGNGLIVLGEQIPDQSATLVGRE